MELSTEGGAGHGGVGVSATNQSDEPEKEETCPRLWCCGFQDRALRDVYANYSCYTRSGSVNAALTVSLLYSVYSIISAVIVYDARRLPFVVISGVLLGMHVLVITVFHLKYRHGVRATQAVLCYAVLAYGVQCVLTLSLSNGSVPVTDCLDWTLVCVYACVVLSPWRLWLGTLLAVYCALCHLVPASLLSQTRGPTSSMHFSPTLVSSVSSLHASRSLCLP